jgi:hypothetical protein
MLIITNSLSLPHASHQIAIKTIKAEPLLFLKAKRHKTDSYGFFASG